MSMLWRRHACCPASAREAHTYALQHAPYMWLQRPLHWVLCHLTPTPPCVPGPQANHTLAPNAGVRVVHGMSQGMDAVSEVCEPPPPEPSRFCLVAERDIRRVLHCTALHRTTPHRTMGQT